MSNSPALSAIPALPAADDIIKDKIFEDLDYFGELVVRSNGQDRIKFWNLFEVSTATPVYLYQNSKLHATHVAVIGHRRPFTYSTSTRMYHMDGSTTDAKCVSLL
jgi:hypothetical protein